MTELAPRRFSALNNPYLMLILASLLWSGNHVVGRAAAGHIPPLAISTLRWFLPLLVLGPLAHTHLRTDWPEIRKHWQALFWLAASGGALFGAAQYIGLQYTTALNVSVLNSLVPVFMVVAASLLFSDYMSTRQWLGVIISVVGVIVIIARGELDTLLHLAFNRGDIIILFNMALFAVYSACLRKKPNIHPLSFLFMFSAISAIMTTPFFAIEMLNGAKLDVSLMSVLAMLYIGFFPSVVAFAAWTRGVELIGSNRSGPFLHLIPVFSAILAGTFLGETLGLFHVVGFALILTGVWLAARKK